MEKNAQALRQEAERRVRQTQERNQRLVQADLYGRKQPIHPSGYAEAGWHRDGRRDGWETGHKPPQELRRDLPQKEPLFERKRGLGSLFGLGIEELLIVGLIVLLWGEEDGLPLIVALVYILMG